MKSKRATAASAEDPNPVDVSLDKKRKRTDDDAAPSGSLKKHKEESKEKREKKKEKKREEKGDKEEKKSKKDKSKYNGKTRKEKKDERKNLQDLPEDMDVDENSEGSSEAAEPSVTQAEAKTNGDANKDKKEKKDKKDKKKDKKEKKAEKEPKSETSASKDVPQGEDAIDLDASTAAKPGRNIVFVGNLPYTATAATITAHFASLKPIAVRCLTKKEDPKMCRGIAFVEFSSPTHQRTCLDKFHHSMFEDGISEPRRINVELTAGGGGKSQGRQGKIMEKNKKLEENRAKRIEKEKVTKEENQGNGNNSRMDIHPSRLARLPGFRN
ncbi:uncharacterized protein TrAFT101_000633 [Trichoderma asperellum]|uniref:RRM domain-containing protein n=1 Tax=Trichoderma asperellum (strain ATCC 204424 / CBS 433.97 / NBRC 101777) TaxID=1042311 RepID=A0A2T3ZK46_TRIA4|nr:hypothetical protein M441DRAFT_158719 [Trichoderma asperellum CBS 433.97]PTB45176.1 hypothetical protein M441DRAFT_158719 [Trichoderma asperellum CBS 433.97]UKZ84737.1 hypothetical protein TrAFT101_000633 [Trichoderma asperellum]